MTVLRDETLQGFWFLPHFPADRISGALKISRADGLELDLNGTLRGEPGVPKERIVFGETSTGEQVTLTHTFLASSTTSFAGYGVSRYQVGTAFVGAHLPQAEDSKAFTFRVRLSGLSEFIGIPIFDVKRETESETAFVQVKAVIGERHRADLADGMICFESELSDSWNGWSQIELRHTPFVQFDSNRPLSFRDFESGPIRSVQTFIELATDGYVELLGLSMYPEGSTHELLALNPQPADEVRILFKARAPLRPQRRRFPAELAFTLRSLGPHWGIHLERWHAAHLKYKSTFDRLFSLHRTDSLPIEHRFLSLVQALESYHRRRFPDRTRMPPAEFKEWKRRMAHDHVKSDRLLFLDAVAFANEPRLLERLQEMWEEMPPAAREALGPRDDFARPIRNARNHLTHQTTNRRSVSVEPRALLGFSMKLLLMLRVLLLNEAGIDAVKALSTAWGNHVLASARL